MRKKTCGSLFALLIIILTSVAVPQVNGSIIFNTNSKNVNFEKLSLTELSEGNYIQKNITILFKIIQYLQSNQYNKDSIKNIQLTSINQNNTFPFITFFTSLFIGILGFFFLSLSIVTLVYWPISGLFLSFWYGCHFWYMVLLFVSASKFLVPNPTTDPFEAGLMAMGLLWIALSILHLVSFPIPSILTTTVVTLFIAAAIYADRSLGNWPYGGLIN